MKIKIIQGRIVYYRPGDESILAEVLEKQTYKRRYFDILPGERWLDLGANIGAFALYCLLHGAIAECYEPDPACFEILIKNVPDCICHQSAVTYSTLEKIQFFQSNKNTHSRGTIYPVRGYCAQNSVPNTYAGTLCSQFFDGVKMDIEGSEGPILDDWLLPKCSKLVLEYHNSRDPSTANLAQRLKQLNRKFKQVRYPKKYDHAIESGVPIFRSFRDRLIYCWEPR